MFQWLLSLFSKKKPEPAKPAKDFARERVHTPPKRSPAPPAKSTPAPTSRRTASSDDIMSNPAHPLHPAQQAASYSHSTPTSHRSEPDCAPTRHSDWGGSSHSSSYDSGSSSSSSSCDSSSSSSSSDSGGW